MQVPTSVCILARVQAGTFRHGPLGVDVHGDPEHGPKTRQTSFMYNEYNEYIRYIRLSKSITSITKNESIYYT